MVFVTLIVGSKKEYSAPKGASDEGGGGEIKRDFKKNNNNNIFSHWNLKWNNFDLKFKSPWGGAGERAQYRKRVYIYIKI